MIGSGREESSGAALLNDTRSLARQALTLGSHDPEGKDVKSFVQMLIAFAVCLKHQLRKTDPMPEITGKIDEKLVEAIGNAQFKPVILMLEMGRWVSRAREKGADRSHLSGCHG